MSVQQEDKKVCCDKNNICQTFYRSAWHQIKVKGQHLQLSGCLLLKQIYFTLTDVFPLDIFSIRNDLKILHLKVKYDFSRRPA